MNKFLKILLLIIVLAFPSSADAHLMGGNGLGSGAAHPLFGLDHLLAMVAVGIIAAILGGKAIWQVPAAFLFFMVLGGVFAVTGLSLPFMEAGIALSVLLLGLAIASSKKFSLNFAVLSVAIFALFHGHAHGQEIPIIANPYLYSLGFVLSTTILHISGVALGFFALKKDFSSILLRFSGVAISLAGVFFLLS